MTTNKEKLGFLLAGALLTVLILYPILKETGREQASGFDVTGLYFFIGIPALL